MNWHGALPQGCKPNVSTGEEPGLPTRRILVPTDFSPCSLRTVDCAIALARQSNASLTILHVIDIDPPAAWTYYGTADALMRRLWVRGNSELAQLKQLAEESLVRTRTLLVEGLPYEAIVENSSGFDLLVIDEPQAKSGWNLFSRHTARRVIEQAKCPVHVARQETGLGDHVHRSEAKVAA